MFRLGYVALSCNPCYLEAEQRPFRWAKYHATVKYHTSQTLDAMWEILSNGKLQSVLRRSFAPLTGGSRRIGSQLGSDHGEEQHHEEIAQVLCTRYLPLRGKGREAIHNRIWGNSCRPARGNYNNNNIGRFQDLPRYPDIKVEQATVGPYAVVDHWNSVMVYFCF